MPPLVDKGTRSKRRCLEQSLPARHNEHVHWLADEPRRLGGIGLCFQRETGERIRAQAVCCSPGHWPCVLAANEGEGSLQGRLYADPSHKVTRVGRVVSPRVERGQAGAQRRDLVAGEHPGRVRGRVVHRASHLHRSPPIGIAVHAPNRRSNEPIAPRWIKAAEPVGHYVGALQFDRLICAAAPSGKIHETAEHCLSRSSRSGAQLSRSLTPGTHAELRMGAVSGLGDVPDVCRHRGFDKVPTWTHETQSRTELRDRAKINSGFAGGILTVWRGTREEHTLSGL